MLVTVTVSVNVEKELVRFGSSQKNEKHSVFAFTDSF